MLWETARADSRVISITTRLRWRMQGRKEGMKKEGRKERKRERNCTQSFKSFSGKQASIKAWECTHNPKMKHDVLTFHFLPQPLPHSMARTSIVSTCLLSFGLMMRWCTQGWTFFSYVNTNVSIHVFLAEWHWWKIILRFFYSSISFNFQGTLYLHYVYWFQLHVSAVSFWIWPKSYLSLTSCLF